MFGFFDKLFHPFECPNPNCRHKFYGLSRIHANEVVCPKCGTRKTIELNQTAGERGGDSDSANELNMKARRKRSSEVACRSLAGPKRLHLVHPVRYSL